MSALQATQKFIKDHKFEIAGSILGGTATTAGGVGIALAFKAAGIALLTAAGSPLLASFLGGVGGMIVVGAFFVGGVQYMLRVCGRDLLGGAGSGVAYSVLAANGVAHLGNVASYGISALATVGGVVGGAIGHRLDQRRAAPALQPA